MIVCSCITGTSYIVPVFGGYIADSVAGKYNTILGAGLLYTLGQYINVSVFCYPNEAEYVVEKY